MRRKGEDGAAPARAVALITRIVSSALQGRDGQTAIDAQIFAQPIILGAQTLPEARATLKAAPGAPLNLTFDLGLPGQTRLRVDGDLETGAQPYFRGYVGFTSANFALLRDWATLGGPSALARVAPFADALPYRSASLSGAVEASPAGSSGRNLKLTLDRSTLTGALAFKAPTAVTPAASMRISPAIRSTSTGCRASRRRTLIGDLDLSLSLRAGSLHIARVGETQIDSGSLALSLPRPGQTSPSSVSASLASTEPRSISRARSAPTRLRRPATCELTGCTISPCWFRASRPAIGAGCWSSGRASFRPRR